ncbi:MAG: VanZ family protein [Muribaculaceae bacterium]|nr:VanZ family protein [Muribaculaceae bacterium]
MRTLSRLPSWMFSGITLLLILWLTLAPKPLGAEPPVLFPGADKIVHALMFGFLATMMLFDRQRKNRWKPAGWLTALTVGSISSIIGICIEFAQNAMNLGRSFEISDILADTAGALIASFLYVPAQKLWLDAIKKRNYN